MICLKGNIKAIHEKKIDTAPNCHCIRSVNQFAFNESKRQAMNGKMKIKEHTLKSKLNVFDTVKKLQPALNMCATLVSNNMMPKMRITHGKDLK